MKVLFGHSPQILVKQIKEVFEIITDWETANKYALYDSHQIKVGFAAERSNGVFHKIIRNIMRSHRSITIDVWDNSDRHILTGYRPWYFFFSDLNVMTQDQTIIGDIKTRFGIIKRKYDLFDSKGRIFASIESFRWKLWTFTIYDQQRNEIGVITKKWGGLMKEVFTDADQFTIDFSKQAWSPEQKSILLFACMSIDLDFFEDNSNSVLDLTD